MWHLIFGPPKIDKLKKNGNIKGLSKALFYRHHFGIQYAAAQALEDVGDETAVEPLIKALASPDVKMRSLVARALGRIGDKRAVEPLVAALKSQNRELLLERIEELKIVEEPIADLLEAIIPDMQANPALRMAAAESFMQEDEGENGEQVRHEAAAMFLGGLEKEIPRIRKHAAGMMREMVKDVDNETLRQRAIQRHKEAIQHENGAVRAAIKVLGDLGDPKAAAPLQEMLKDADEAVIREAYHALNKLGGVVEE